jgi:cytidylate kinase
MNVRVVTIDREFASGAAAIAKILAERLGWKLWDQRLTDEIARLARCERSEVAEREERRDPLYYRLLKSFLLGSFEGSLNVPRLNLVDSDVIVRHTKHIIDSAAEAGHCVIVGRGAAYFLADRPDTIHVFIYAPYEEKVKRLIDGGTNPQEAARLVDVVDSERADFVKKYFNIDWPSRGIYHLMINSRIGDEAVIRTILNGMATHGEPAAP